MRTRSTVRRPGTIPNRFFLGALAVGLIASAVACQTPPKKANTSTTASRNGADRERSVAPQKAIDLFSASPELFGTDPRLSRPALVTDTVFAVVIGSTVLLSGGVLVSAVRSARGKGPRRGRSRDA
jgi:hypothetical protein